ncbi:MAG: sigma-54 dependent transcriptional regulator [Proteobacteria bacterium]|nr:sigma-54 dependent transcriptional regulator [Pseudomonadota bacterium]MBU1714598.1 sigma-54 dependent transcriptional regulator [Pseudomonadota bacterium]
MRERARKILIVDDEQNMRIALFEALSRNGYEVAVAENGRMALDMLRKNIPDLVVSDIKMPEMNGIEFLRKLRQIHPDLPVVIITGYATIDTAVEAMKHGAIDYIIKPFSVEVIENTVERIFQSAPPSSAAGLVLPGVKKSGAVKSPRPIIGEDPKLKMLMQRARSVASSKATVLLLGESGTGKEVFARYLHSESDRCNEPFVALNCAALPETLLESELFGHEKGAFTGAINSKKGKFELADGGFLLLDEIGEIPLHLQAKLLRVLQEEEVDRLGGKGPIKIDVHVIATTNRSLEAAVKESTFRSDLYYRLNVIPLRLPPLRERGGDIEMLADYFIEKYSVQYSKEVKRLSVSAMYRFKEYEWPGNIREMENLIERAVLLSTGDCLELWDLWYDEEVPPDMFSNQPSADGAYAGGDLGGSFGDGVTLREVERQMILQALNKTDNNRTHAAKILGVSVRTLRNKLHEYRNQGVVD